jgi:hypothetical protein
MFEDAIALLPSERRLTDGRRFIDKAPRQK